MTMCVKVRRCGCCKRTLPAKAFHVVMVRGRHAARSYCKECERAYHRERYRRLRDELAELARERAHRERARLIARRHAALVAARPRQMWTATECGL